MEKKRSFEFDAAGWGFWVIVFFVLVGPAIYGSWHVVTERASRGIPVGMGLVGAALGAGLVSWAVNAVLQFKRKKEKLAERRKSKKKR